MAKTDHQRNLEDVPQRYRGFVHDLDAQFGSVMHDLWTDSRLNVAPSRIEFVESIRDKHPDELANRELDQIAFGAVTTMGGELTLKFVLPRFFAAYFAHREDGWVTEPVAMMEKLRLAKVDDWPQQNQLAVLRALLVFARSELELLREEVERRNGDPQEAIDLENSAVSDWAKGRIALLSKPSA